MQQCIKKIKIGPNMHWHWVLVAESHLRVCELWPPSQLQWPLAAPPHYCPAGSSWTSVWAPAEIYVMFLSVDLLSAQVAAVSDSVVSC